MQLGSAEVFLTQSQFLLYGNGKDKTPTAILFDKEQTKGLYFNQSNPKVCEVYLLVSFNYDSCSLKSLFFKLNGLSSFLLDMT